MQTNQVEVTENNIETINNKIIEDADIAQTQEDQEADIDAIIEDAKDLVAATVIDDDLDLGDLSGILEAQAKEID